MTASISVRSDLLRASVELPKARGAVDLLRTTDFSRGCYLPIEPDGPMVGVAFMPFRWGDDSPTHWLFTSVGLSSQQNASVRPSGYRTPPHIELCFSMLAPSTQDWLDLAGAWHAGRLSEIVNIPDVISRFHGICASMSLWIENGEAFAFADSIRDASIAARFPSALLCPPVPEFAACRVVPFSVTEEGDAVRAEIDVEDWADPDALQRASSHVFLQCVPLISEEFAIVSAGNGRDFFLNALLPTDEEFESGLHSSSIVSDLSRGSRIGPYFAAQEGDQA